MGNKDLDTDDRKEAIQDYARKKKRGSKFLGIIIIIVLFLIMIYLIIFKF